MHDNEHLSRADKTFGRLGLWMFDHRWLVVLLTVLLLGGGLYFASKPRPDNSFDAFFNKSDPYYRAYLEYDEEFGSDEVIYILYSAPGAEHGVFDLGVMKQIGLLTQAIEDELPFVDEVTSLTNVEFVTAEDDLLEIYELGRDMPEDQPTMLERRDAMMAKPIYRGAIVNDDASHGALMVEMSVTSSDPWDSLRFDPDGGDGIENFYPQVPAHRIQEILARPEYSGIDFRLTGDVMLNTAYNEVVPADSALLALATILVAGLVSWVNFRFSPIGLFGPLGVIVLSLVLMVAFMGAAGYDLGMLFLIAPSTLIAIAVAQSIHLIAEFRLQQSAGLDRRTSVQRAFEHAAMPCLLAALTTAVGIVVMAGSELRSLAELAVYLCAGVLLTFVGSVTLMACLMAFGRERAPSAAAALEPRSERSTQLLGAIARFNTRHPRGVLAGFGLALLLSVIGASQLRISFNFLEDFKPSVPFRADTDYIRDVMGGMINVAVVYDTGKSEGIKRAAVMQHIEAVQALADQQPEVKKSWSLVDVIKDLNQSMNEDDPSFHRLPDSDALISQYLLLYEISGGRELNDLVSTDLSRTTLEIRFDFLESERLKQVLEGFREYIDAHPLDGVEVRFTGVGLLWVGMGEYISASQIEGYTLAFLIIAVAMCVAFRSVRTGLLAMIPNVFPIVLVLGGMGWLGVHLDYLRLLLATVAIGIAVDDTVHIVTRMQKEFLRCGDYEEAARATLLSVGRALIVTTTVLTLAFMMFQLSQMAILASFGTLLSLIMVTALVADLFLLPVLICTFKPFGPEKGLNASHSGR